VDCVVVDCCKAVFGASSGDLFSDLDAEFSFFHEEIIKMKSFMDEKITTRWVWNKSQQRHSDRLKQIKGKFSARIDNCAPRISRLPNAGPRFLEQERKTDIQVKNDKILGILIDISRGRRSTSTGTILESALNLPRKKSLNVIARKKEVEKINNDNEAMARRLMRTTQGVSFKKLDEEWKATVKYKKSISKAKFRNLPGVDKSRKATREKSGVRNRTKSLCEDNLMFLSSDKQSSPINTQRSELVFIDSHKPSSDLLIKGTVKTRYLKSCEPIRINPPKTFIKLDPLPKPS